MESLSKTTLSPGRPWPLGATWDGQGVNFAIFSSHAQAMDLCLFDDEGLVERARLPLPKHTSDVWHGYLPGARPGLVYGLRAHGLWNPLQGHHFNPHKILLDPYAREVVGSFQWRDEHFGFNRLRPLEIDTRDNATWALKARVVKDDFDWEDDHPPLVDHQDTVLYELHVKGFSRTNAAIPQELRGTYAGLAHEASLTHLKDLGVTALSLLPVHYALSEERLALLGLHNYWGYNTLAFFATNPALASRSSENSPRDEFRSMVKTIHAHGMEVLLDVVFNHTAESDETGPMLSFRGLDNASYYRLRSDSNAYYENHAGCGNTLDIRQNRVLQLVMDSLRYWVGVMHVDGFRFDLAPILGRGDHGFESGGAFFTAIAQDPLLSRVKMIAEPWDTGPGGYQVGSFPIGWMEWNDRFRDVMRSYWVRHHDHARTRGDFAMRLCGSSDLYQHRQRRQRPPAESVNYIVSHDGFTLADLVSYNDRHNLANGENNRDGQGDNQSFNCGEEGPSHNPQFLALRSRLQRVLLATTLLAQGTPMLCAGDELGHTQSGNNNPYCQDNETTWIQWTNKDADLMAFTAWVISLRRQLLPFRNQWYTGDTDAHGVPDLAWLRSDGKALDGGDWGTTNDVVLGCLIGHPGRAKSPIVMLFNPSDRAQHFLLPPGIWLAVLDSSLADGRPNWQGAGGTLYNLPAQSLTMLVTAGTPLQFDNSLSTTHTTH
jgi:glycogen operon protein